jgi:hypothetical protein
MPLKFSGPTVNIFQGGKITRQIAMIWRDEAPLNICHRMPERGESGIFVTRLESVH